MGEVIWKRRNNFEDLTFHSNIYLEKCTLKQWNVKEGHFVVVNQKIGESTSRNNVTDIIAPDNGIVTKILVKPGAFVDKRTTVAVLEIISSKESIIDTLINNALSTVRVTKNNKKYKDRECLAILNTLAKKKKQLYETLSFEHGLEKTEWINGLILLIEQKLIEERAKLVKIYRILHFQEMRKYNSGYLPYRLSWEERSRIVDNHIVSRDLDLRLRNTVQSSNIHRFKTQLREDIDKSHSHPQFHGISISTYPFDEVQQKRDGEPICDHYYALISSTISILSLADGCNWGESPSIAAIKACKGFVDFLYNHKHSMYNTTSVAHLCLQAICNAHNTIIAGEQIEGKAIGTTTLLGGVLAKLNYDSPSLTSSPRSPVNGNNNGNNNNNNVNTVDDEYADEPWVFVFGSIGDCKAYVYSCKSDSIRELNKDSRKDNVTDASDCGGRIGPYVDDGPDIRNLCVFSTYCNEGDIIFICSDGVHDNFDPQHQGLTPQDCGVNVSTWKDTESVDQLLHAKVKFREKLLKDVIGAIPSPQSVCENLVEYCKKITLPSQNFLLTNPGKRLPTNYSLYPGKMDHTTIIAYKVGEILTPGNSPRGHSPRNVPPRRSPPIRPTTPTENGHGTSILPQKVSPIFKKTPNNVLQNNNNNNNNNLDINLSKIINSNNNSLRNRSISDCHTNSPVIIPELELLPVSKTGNQFGVNSSRTISISTPTSPLRTTNPSLSSNLRNITMNETVNNNNNSNVNRSSGTITLKGDSVLLISHLKTLINNTLNLIKDNSIKTSSKEITDSLKLLMPIFISYIDSSRNLGYHEQADRLKSSLTQLILTFKELGTTKDATTISEMIPKLISLREQIAKVILEIVTNAKAKGII